MYCNMMFDYAYLDHFDGKVYICPWMDPARGSIGNILTQDFYDIWHSEKAEKIRDTARDGSYSYCRMVACPHLQNRDLPDKEMDPEHPWRVHDTPGEVNLAFDFICNISCPTCRCEIFKPNKDYAQKVEKILEKIIPVASKARKISASGHGDPFASPYMMKVLENLKPERDDFEILLETNGIFLDEAHWDRISHLGNYNLDIVVTTNSYHEPIYNQISRGGNLEKLKKNQLFLKKLREENKVKHTTNAIVVQEKNYWEIPEFIDKSLNVYGFDNVVLRPVYNWGNLTEEEYWFKDVLNPCHPYHEEYKKIINMPIVKDNPRVYNFGGETMHEPAPMPGSGSPENIKHRAYDGLFRKWLKTDDVDSVFRRYFEDNSKENVFIYGAGELGRRVASILKNLDINVLGFIDMFVTEDCVDNIPVYKIGCDETLTANTIFITPIHIFDELEKSLREHGIKGEIVSVNDIFD